jgi:hypothetical protein
LMRRNPTTSKSAMPRHRLTMSGYWKKGEIDFRDSD